MDNSSPRSYRAACLKLTLTLLGVWAFVSLGCSVLLRAWMDSNMPAVGHAPFGFWMAQQGSIICFVALLIVYAFVMKRMDTIYVYSEEQGAS